jgi:hypothetical protein
MSMAQRVVFFLLALILGAVGLWLIRDASNDEVVASTPSQESASFESAEGAMRRSAVFDAASQAAQDERRTEPSPASAAPTPSPFDSAESDELKYAVQLVVGAETGPREWHKAAEVFQRCVDANRFNFLCQRGVKAAWERIDSDGGPSSALVVAPAGASKAARLAPSTGPTGMVKGPVQSIEPQPEMPTR